MSSLYTTQAHNDFYTNVEKLIILFWVQIQYTYRK